jgi:hypothetical protein
MERDMLVWTKPEQALNLDIVKSDQRLVLIYFFQWEIHLALDVILSIWLESQAFLADYNNFIQKGMGNIRRRRDFL